MAINRDRVRREAEKLVQKGKVEQAIREYKKLLKVNPNDAVAINRIGDLYGRLGRVEEAVELYERLADHFSQDGFANKAIAILKKINRLMPQRLEIFEKLGELYVQQGLMVEARSQYEILAEWHARNGDMERALHVQRKLAELDPGNHMVQLRLADALVQAGELDEAVETFNRLISVLLGRSKLDEAERLARHVLEARPPSCSFLVPVCQALAEAGKGAAAAELLEAGLGVVPGDPALTALQREMAGGAAPAGAATPSRETTAPAVMPSRPTAELSLEEAFELLRGDPDNPELQLAVGRACLKAGDGERARSVLLPLLDNLLRRGELGEAQTISRDLLEVLPDDPEILARALRAFEASGDDEMVITIKGALADRHFRDGNEEAARRLYMELVDLDPENDLFRRRHLELSSARPVEGTPRSPGATPSPAIPMPPAGVPIPGEPPPEALERLTEANVFAKYGLVDKAVHHLEEILETHPEFAEARERLVEILEEEGEAGRAAAVAEPLLAHYEATGNERKAAWVRGLVSPGAGEMVAGGGAEEAGEEEILLLDVDEVLAESGEFPVLEEVPQPETPGELAGSELLFEEPGQVRPEPGGTARSGDAGVDEIIFSELGDLVEMPKSTTETGAPEVVDHLAEPVAEEVAAGVRETDEVVSPTIPEVPMEMEAADLVEITETIGGPSSSELEQLDFFIAQELYEDAARILADLEVTYPEDPDLAQRRLTLKEKGVILVEPEAPEVEPEEKLFAEEEEYIDLASELEKELAEEEAMVEEATGQGKDEALLEEVFREFQRGVAEQLSEEDSDTHFNLGIAYKEMGLLAEAIGEFQIASRDPDFRLEACSMIGVCYTEQGLHEEAVSWYRKALEIENLSTEARLAILYDLASALEASGDQNGASEAFGKVATLDPGYRDVLQRVAGLQQQRQAN